jgi:hypothetical protein
MFTPQALIGRVFGETRGVWDAGGRLCITGVSQVGLRFMRILRSWWKGIFGCFGEWDCWDECWVSGMKGCSGREVVRETSL